MEALQGVELTGTNRPCGLTANLIPVVLDGRERATTLIAIVAGPWFASKTAGAGSR